MNSVSLGDLSQSFLFQRRGVTLRTELTRLSDELATGQITNVRSATKGNYSYLSDLEHGIRVSSAYDVTASEAKQFAEGVQNALERFQMANTELANDLLRIVDSPASPVASQGSDYARNQLNLMFSALNSDVAGRNLFSGSATDLNPLTDVETFLTELETAVSGASNVADIRTAAQAWFDSATGFSVVTYQGSDTRVSPFKFSRNESVSVDVRANDAVFRDILMNAGLSAIADSGALNLDPAIQNEIHRESSLALLAGTDPIVSVRAAVGAAEERIDQLQARNSAEAIALEFARAELLQADPYETAKKLEGVRFQLESLYTITARFADLALVNYVR